MLLPDVNVLVYTAKIWLRIPWPELGSNRH
jgi:hypothetical protein